jgi:hypothetical protein
MTKKNFQLLTSVMVLVLSVATVYAYTTQQAETAKKIKLANG